MFKKMLLSSLLCLSTWASAQINLDLDLTISHQEETHHTTGNVVVDENCTTSIVFNGLESLVINVNTQVEDQIVTMQVQLFQLTETNELTPVTEPLSPIQVPFGQAGTIIVNETDNSGSLVLVVTPTLVVTPAPAE